MAIDIQRTSIPDVVMIEPRVFRDPRGFFLETFHSKAYAAAGINCRFVQDNHSHSQKGTLRGLHYQLRQAQAKLMYVISGAIFDVAVDIRRGSSTFGKWAGVTLSAGNKRQLFIPAGFAHGFYVLSETADVLYKCSDFYAPDDEYGILWSDPDIGIDWPLAGNEPLLSEKDTRFSPLSKIRAAHLPVLP